MITGKVKQVEREVQREMRFSLRLVNSKIPVKQPEEVRCQKMELRLGIWAGDTLLELRANR